MTRPVLIEAQPFLQGLRFAEGPRWHDGWLWFSDITQNQVMRVREDGVEPEIVAKIESPSGLGFLPDGTLLVVNMRARLLHHVDRHGNVDLYANLSRYGDILNDMVVTPDGRAYVDCYRLGSPVTPPLGPDGIACAQADDINRYYVNGLGMSPNLEGEILLVHPDRRVQVVASGLNYPNGLGIMPDGRTMIVSISHESVLMAFDICDDGALTGARLWAALPGRHPDGLCVDVDGGVWVACLAISAFLRILEGGCITHQIPTYGRCAIAPVLGSANRRTLFLVSMEPLDLANHRSWIDRVRVTSPAAVFSKD